MTLPDLQKKAADDLGLDQFDGTLASLSPGEQEKLYDRMADIVQASPSDFADNIQAWAKKRIGSGWYGKPMENYTAGEAVSDFVKEAGNQAVKINEAVNPFSESNRKMFYFLVVAGVAFYFLAPSIGAMIRESKVPAK